MVATAKYFTAIALVCWDEGPALGTINTRWPLPSPRSEGMEQKCNKEKVSAASTLLALDWPVGRPDHFGPRLFSRVPRVCKGGNAVRVPPREQMSSQAEAFRPSDFRHRSEPESVLKLGMLAQTVP